MRNLKSLSAVFDSPEAVHTACPFWFWNGDLNPDELMRQLHAMYEQGIRAFVIHPRKGLMITYLSEDWFDRCRLVIEEAAQLGMQVWIYDEENWPSGYAGGRVLARDPNYIGQNLSLERHYVKGPASFRLELERPGEVQAVMAARIAELRPLPTNPLIFHKTAAVEAPWTDRSRYTHVYADEEPVPLTADGNQLNWNAPAGYWCIMIACQQPTNWIAAYSDCPYTDLINAAATEAFIQETHEQYYKRFAEHFGKTVLGFFVDEPGFYNNFWDRNVGSITWTHDFADEFERRRGYSLLQWLPALWEDLGQKSETVRFDYWQTISELLDERFFNKLARWCADHGVMLTGHLEWEEWLFTMTRHSATPFKALSRFHVPGVDKIDEVTEKLAEKLVASVAHANGRSRVLSETFALIGWKLAPPYMKQIVDYQYVRGVNWLSCHGFYFSIEDFRKYECPPSEFFQNPWWDHSRPLWDYIARLSAALSQGTHVAPVALYYPIEQAWASITPHAPGAFNGGTWEAWQLPDKHLPVQQTDIAMLELGLCLLEHQYDFDLVDHSLLGAAEVADGKLRVNQERFDAVVVPPVPSLAAASLSRLLDLAAMGGTVLFVQKLPERVICGDEPAGWASLREQLSQHELPGFERWGRGRIGFVPQGTAAAISLLQTVLPRDVEVEISEDDNHLVLSQENRNGILRETRIRQLRHAVKYHRRRVNDADVYFLVNESDRSFTASLHLSGAAGVEEWLPHTGERRTITTQAIGAGKVAVTLPFAPWQSYLLVSRSGTPDGMPVNNGTAKQIQALEHWSWQIDRFEWSGTLASWHELGLAHYSGQGVYRTTFTLPESLLPAERLVLDLGNVFETAQVCINDTSVGSIAWAPYKVDITEHVRTGDNDLTIVVANTNTNAFERRERPSGLLGPVRLITLELEE